MKLIQAKQETDAIVEATKAKNIEMPELSNLEKRIAMLEKQQKEKDAVKTEDAPSAVKPFTTSEIEKPLGSSAVQQKDDIHLEAEPKVKKSAVKKIPLKMKKVQLKKKSALPDKELIQLGFIEDWDESTQEYKDQDTVKEEGEMVVATAQSIHDYTAHYDEVADKQRFHKDLPLSNYQKIVDDNVDTTSNDIDKEPIDPYDSVRTIR